MIPGQGTRFHMPQLRVLTVSSRRFTEMLWKQLQQFHIKMIGYVSIPVHTDLKQGAVLPLRLQDQASTDFYTFKGRVDASDQP